MENQSPVRVFLLKPLASEELPADQEGGLLNEFDLAT